MLTRREEAQTMSIDLSGLDATAQADLVRKGDVSAVELVEAAVSRIEKVNPELNAVITPLFDKARAQAGGKLEPGPFRGVPFLLKDLGATSAGDPLHSGMQLMKKLGFVAPDDTYLTRKFREAGFILLGKTNTPEIGLAATTEPLAYGPTRNPWNRAHSAGGSSGGSAAAVAARLVPAAHANDGGGSIRIPASECGIVGLKPSRGRVSLGPLFGEAWHGLAIEGAVTISVRDAAAILDAICGPMPGDPYFAPPPHRPFLEEVGRDPGRLRIGLMTERPAKGTAVHAECVRAVERTGRLLQSLGHRVEVSHPEAFDDPDMTSHLERVIVTHAAQTLDFIGRALGQPLKAEDVEPYTWRLAAEGTKVSGIDYVTSADWVHGWSRRMAAWWAEGFDLLLTPTIAEPPPRLGDLGGPGGDPSARWHRNLEVIPFTPAFNVTGQPAISLPLYWTPDGLPVGVHFVGAYAREDLLIRLAAQLEQAEPWADRRPPICA
jgi:amidase